MNEEEIFEGLKDRFLDESDIYERVAFLGIEYEIDERIKTRFDDIFDEYGIEGVIKELKHNGFD